MIFWLKKPQGKLFLLKENLFFFLRWAVIDQKGIQVSVATQSFTFLLQFTVLLRPGEMGRNEASLGKRNVAKKIKNKCCRPNSKTLKVRFVTPEDAGVFECQVSTSPKLSLIFRLSVLGKSCNPIEVPSGAPYVMMHH